MGLTLKQIGTGKTWTSDGAKSSPGKTEEKTPKAEQAPGEKWTSASGRLTLTKSQPEGLSLPTLSESVKGKAKRPAAEAGRNQVEGLPSARTPTAYQENAAKQAERIRGILDSGRTSDGRAVTPGMEKTLREALSKYEAQAEDPNGGFLTRLENTVKGGAKGFLSGHMDAMGTLYQSGQAGRTARDAEALAEYRTGAARAERELEELLEQDGLSAREVLAGLPKEDGLLSAKRKDYLAAAGVQDPADVLAVVNVLEDYRRKAEAMEKAPGIQEQAGEAARDLAAAVQRSGARDLERAKAGKGMAQNILVDATASTVQMIGDAAANAVLGTQGSMIPFAARALGGGTQAAREEGADLKHQILYGGAMAAKEVFTEKMFNIALPFSRVYGGGALDDAVERAIGKAVDRFAKTDAGKKLLGGGLTFAASALSEGAEEFVGDWMEWQMPRIYGGDPDSAAETLQNSLYDFLVGAASGAMGGAVNPGTYRYEVKPLSLPTLEEAAQQTAQRAPHEPTQDVLREGETQGPAQAETPPEALSLPKLEENGGGQKETAPGMGAANENGLLALTEQEKVNLSSGKKNKIVSTFQEAVSFIKNALSDRQNVDRAYLGKVPDVTAQKVLNETGVDIRGYNAILPGDAVRHMFKNHGDTAAEAERGQVALTPETAANITAVLSNPDKVTFSKQTDAYGRKTLMFEKKVGDIYITAQAVTDGTKSLTTDTLYIKKGSPTTVDEMQASPGQTSETSSGLTLTETISQPAGEVNGGKIQQPGGLNDGEGAGGTVPAEAGDGGRSGRDTVFDEGPERHGSVGPGEQAGSLGGRTGRAQKTIDPGTAAIKRQALGKTLQGQKVSSRSLGIPSGTDAAVVTVIPESTWDEGLRNTARKVERETGKRTTFVLDRIPVTGADGKVRRVRGVNMADGIILQADNYGATVEQLADHEIFHDLAAENPGLVRMLEDRISETMGREELNRVIDTYMDALGGVYDNEVMTGEELERAYLNILEEIYADAYAGINAFGANAGQFSAAVEETLEDRGLGRRGRETGEATDRTTGPPSSRYSYGGRYANRADSESLTEAERLEMQGLDPEDIRQETGWFRGMDGKWRFEIDDSGMEYSRWGDMNRTDRAEYARFRELEGKFIDGSITEAEQTELRGLIDQGHGSGRAEEQGLLKLSDFIRHDELFQNYPQLRKTGLVFRQLPEGTRGTYSPERDIITISEDLRNAPEDTVIHEIQHAIQKAEGFAGGSSPEYWAQKQSESSPVRENDGRIQRADAEYRRIFDSAPEEFKNKVREINRARLEKDYDTAESLIDEIYESKYAELYSELDMADFERRGDRGEVRRPGDLYRDTAGEIEARDAAKRRKLSPEERRLSLPDLGDENTVFAEEDGGSLSFAGKEIPTYEELIQKPDIQIVDIRGERTGRLSDQRKNFLSSEAAKKLYAAPVVNKDTGEALFITPKTITHTFSNLGQDQVALAEHLPEVIREAVLTHGEQSWKAPDDMTTGVFTLFGAVRTDEDVQPVKLKVKEYSVDGQRLPQNVREYLGTGLQPQTYASVYDGKVLVLESIEKEEASSSAPSTAPKTDAAEKYPSASSAISVKDLLSLVKGDAERYVPKPGREVRYSVDDSAEGAWENRPKTPLEAVQREIERLSGKEYQERILREEGPKAIVENERTIRRLQKRAEKLAEKQGVNLENTKEPVEDLTSEGTKKKLSPKNKAMMEAIRKELDQRQSEEYKTELLHKGGVNAVVENEREIKKLQTRLDKLAGRKKKKKKTPGKPVAESKPIIAKRDLRKNLLDALYIPEGQRAELGALVDGVADKLLREGALTEEIRNDLFNRLYSSGVVTEAADAYFQEGRNAVAGGRIFVNDIIKGDFGDDWNAFRKRAMAANVYLTNDQSDAGVDVWNQELGETLPGLFNQDELDGRAILERIVQVAEEGKDQKVSLAEYTKQLAGEEYVSEREILDNMERQMDWALRTFAEKADLEIKLRDRTGVKIAQERERFAESSRRQREREALRRGKEREQRRDMMRRQRENRELRELQQRTLKQLQWLSKNRYRAPEELRSTWDAVLGDIDIYAVGAANEMNWSKKYEATWQNLAQMYQEAKKNDPNFLPSKDLERIVARLDGDKIADMDVSALQDLYKAVVGLRTEFYNRNNVINDEQGRMFAEVYADSKREIEEAPESYTGKGLDKFVNLEQLTPMNVLERMGGWDPEGTFYSMAKQLEKGERDARAYTVEAKRQIEDFLTENPEWVKRADGQGKDAIWYELEVPELLKLGMGDKPIFGPTIKVYMTPAQKVHLYLESKSTDNLRHMTGGRTFVNRELYSQGKRAEALAQGVTVKLAPETVKKIVSNMTEEEMELARVLEQYYNGFAAGKINQVSNVLYGYDKAVSKNYAPIFTNQNYTKSEIGIYDATAEGVGHLKGRQYAVNPSYNISAFDAFERHIDQTSRFVGMAVPARNWQTLLNWREQHNSTGDVITHKWGQEGKRYIENLLTELQGGKVEEKSGAEKLADTVLSNYISSVFGANPSIVFKQAMSFPLAGTYLGWENVPNIAAALRTDDKLINTYTSELAYRLMGYATPETAQLKDNPSKLSENRFLRFTFGGGAITAMDGWTVKSMWRWAENAVRRENPELETGTQEQIEAGQSPFYQEVAKRFEEAVSRSQPMYDVMHRSGAMRNSSGIARALTLFKTVPQQQYNMLRQTVAEAQRAKRIYGEKSQNYSEAKKKAGRTVQGVILAGLGIEAINFLNAMLKNGAKRYKDEDEEEMTWASFGKQFLQGFMADNMGMMIGGDLIAELLGSAVTGENWYGIETPGITQIQDVLEEFLAGCKNIQKLVRDGYGVVKNGGDLKEYFRRNGADYLGALEEGLATIATYFGGVAYNNIKGYALGALRWMSPETETAFQDFLKTADKNGLAGLKGEALETRIYDILKNRIGDAERETAKDLAALYAAGYKAAVPPNTPESVTVDSETRKLNAFQKQLYDSVWRETVGGTLDEVTASGAFREADQETQAKMLRELYGYAGELAKAEVFDDYPVSDGAEKTKEALRSGLDMADYLALKAAGGVDRYLKAAGQGMEAKDATQAALTVSEIKDAAEDKTPKLVLYREALRETRDEDAQMAALSLLMSEGEYARLETGVYRGITPEMYVTARESIAEIDENNSVSQDEAARAIGSMPGLTDEERGVLWQLQNKSWKPEKNPFSVKAGERVYKDLQDGGGTLERPEEELRGLELPRLE